MGMTLSSPPCGIRQRPRVRAVPPASITVSVFLVNQTQLPRTSCGTKSLLQGCSPPPGWF